MNRVIGDHHGSRPSVRRAADREIRRARLFRVDAGDGHLSQRLHPGEFDFRGRRSNRAPSVGRHRRDCGSAIGGNRRDFHRPIPRRTRIPRAGGNRMRDTAEVGWCRALRRIGCPQALRASEDSGLYAATAGRSLGAEGAIALHLVRELSVDFADNAAAALAGMFRPDHRRVWHDLATDVVERILFDRRRLAVWTGHRRCFRGGLGWRCRRRLLGRVISAVFFHLLPVLRPRPGNGRSAKTYGEG